MSDDRQEPPIANVDASGQPLDVEDLIRPQQPPMEDAAGPQEEEVEDVSKKDLSVQGGS